MNQINFNDLLGQVLPIRDKKLELRFTSFAGIPKLAPILYEIALGF